MGDLTEQSTLHVVPISAGAGDRWRLSDQYVEVVWSEFIGTTATLLARRFGRTMEAHPGRAEVDLVDLPAAVGVQRRIALKALARLHRFEIFHISPERSLVGVSGFAPCLQGGRVLRLNEGGRLVHDRLLAASQIVARAARSASGRAPARRPLPVRGLAL